MGQCCLRGAVPPQGCHSPRDISQCQPVTVVMQEGAARVKHLPGPEDSQCWSTQPIPGHRQQRVLWPPCSISQGPELILSEKTI